MTRALIAAVILLTAVPAALAQDQGPALRPHRFTVSAGLAWLGGYGLGTNAATLRRNEPGTATPGSFTLFNADASIVRASGVEARLGFALTRVLALEFGGSYSRPAVAVDITSDSEAGAVPRLADQRLSQYTIDVRALWQLSRFKLGSHARPYVTAGGGYLRQLDVDRVKAETGKVLHAGGGVRYWLRGGDAQRRALGVRAEFNAQMRSGGFDFADKTRVSPALNVFGFFGF